MCAVLSFLDGEYFLDGIERMHERPIRDLIDSLRKLGAQIEYLKNDGYPPIKISHIKKNDVNTAMIAITQPEMPSQKKILIVFNIVI